MRERKWRSYTKRERERERERKNRWSRRYRSKEYVGSRFRSTSPSSPVSFFFFFCFCPPRCLIAWSATACEPWTRPVYRMYFTRDESRLLWNSTRFRSYSASETAPARATADGRKPAWDGAIATTLGVHLSQYPRRAGARLVHWGRAGWLCSPEEPTRNECKLMTTPGDNVSET